MEHVPGQVTDDYVKENGLAPPFPEIRATEKSSPLNSQDKEFDLPILDVSGNLAYVFRCSYRGRFGIRCGLFRKNEDINLLGDSVDPYSGLPRSLLIAEQFYGKCASYPEWGSERTFELRHMRITLSLSRPEFTSGAEYPYRYSEAITNGSLAVRVNPDNSADSPVATPPRYAYWGYIPLPLPKACERPVLNPRTNTLPSTR